MRTLFALLLMASPSLAQVNLSDSEATLQSEPPQIVIEVRLLTGPASMFSQLKAGELIRTPSHSDKLAFLEVTDAELLDQGGDPTGIGPPQCRTTRARLYQAG